MMSWNLLKQQELQYLLKQQKVEEELVPGVENQLRLLIEEAVHQKQLMIQKSPQEKDSNL